MTDKRIDKLRKLIAHERSARQIGSIGEAEVFASKIQEWLTRHKLTLEDVAAEAALLAGDEEIGSEQVTTRTKRRIFWQEDLASGIAKSNSCEIVILSHYMPGVSYRRTFPRRRFVYKSRYAHSILFVGRKADREICRELFDYFTTLALELAHQAAETNKSSAFYKRFDYDPQWRATRTKEFKQGFLAGFAGAINKRLIAARRDIEKDIPADSTALVLARRADEAVRNYREQHWIERDSRSTTERRIPLSGLDEGRKAGGSVALTSKTLH